ncbi:MAG: hypothetical protein MI919_28515, partial [Holophagales bacterium]|nr:hypothetical protein [Holophagales bacterium]
MFESRIFRLPKIVLALGLVLVSVLGAQAASAQVPVTIQTSSGNYLTAVNGGNMGSPVGVPPNSTAIHTDAQAIGEWEVFNLISLGSSHYALQTSGGYFLTAVNGGGIGDPAGMPSNSVPMHTDAHAAGVWETFNLISLGCNKVALQTADGRYVSAVGGGGQAEPPGFAANSWPLHTNAVWIGGWETFK